jgi:hypothetical protein
VRLCTIPHVDSADEITERGEAGCGHKGEGVTMKYRLTPQPQDNVTTLGLASVSVTLRNCLSVLVPDLKERGTSTPHPVPRPRTSLTYGQSRVMLPPVDTKGGVLSREGWAEMSTLLVLCRG